MSHLWKKTLKSSSPCFRGAESVGRSLASHGPRHGPGPRAPGACSASVPEPHHENRRVREACRATATAGGPARALQSPRVQRHCGVSTCCRWEGTVLPCDPPPPQTPNICSSGTVQFQPLHLRCTFNPRSPRRSLRPSATPRPSQRACGRRLAGPAQRCRTPMKTRG